MVLRLYLLSWPSFPELVNSERKGGMGKRGITTRIQFVFEAGWIGIYD